MNIEKLINDDELIVLLKDKCSFRPIKMMRLVIFCRSVIDWPKIKHLRCQKLLCSTKLCPPIIGFYNVMVELRSIIIFMIIKNIIKEMLFSPNYTKSVAANHFISMK